MAAVVITPVILAVFYLLFVAAHLYAAEARFSVRASATQPGGGGAPSTSLLSSGGNGGTAVGFVDGWAVRDFLNSRDCMKELDRQIGLGRYFYYAGSDPANHLRASEGEDGLFRAYGRMVHNSYNMVEQINVLKVQGFSPADAATVSQGLLKVAQDFVNKMDEQGIADALKVSRKTLQSAEQQDRTALSELAQWRLSHGNLDPTADAAMLLNQVAQLETELSTAQINLEKIRALGNPNHPMLHPAELQVAELQQRLTDMRGRMSGNGAGTEASQMKSYVALNNAQTFADANLLAARQNYQQAFTDALKLQRYLSVIARPVPEGTPSSPNPGMILLEALAVGFGLAGLTAIGRATYQSFRHA